MSLPLPPSCLAEEALASTDTPSPAIYTPIPGVTSCRINPAPDSAAPDSGTEVPQSAWYPAPLPVWITIAIVDRPLRRFWFTRILSDRPLGPTFQLWASRVNERVQDLGFLFEGRFLSRHDTPDSVYLTDNRIIEAIVLEPPELTDDDSTDDEGYDSPA